MSETLWHSIQQNSRIYRKVHLPRKLAKVASYMSLSALPMFIAKPINGVVGGLLVSYFCYDGIAAKMDTGHIDFWHSPELMWTLYLIMAVISPVAIILTKDSFVSDHPEEDAADKDDNDEKEEAATQNA